jgi:membrane protease YdiL (CAAX protease family)
MTVGVLAGLTLGLFARGYIALLLHFPAVAEMVHASEEHMAKVSGLKLSYGLIAITFAPLAEEYLFRGLLFRALDREWGGWRAVAASAALFAIYHAPLAWLPVGLLGMAGALLFKNTGRLAPAVILHMVYNAVVF